MYRAVIYEHNQIHNTGRSLYTVLISGTRYSWILHVGILTTLVSIGAIAPRQLMKMIHRNANWI